MLHFWSTWCVACEHELRMLENFKKHIRPGNLQIISIAIDSTLEDVRRIMNKNSLSGDFYIDSEQTTKDYFEITGIPQTIMLNHKGERIRFLAPETGLSSFSANGPQTWDRPDVIEYFSRRFR